MFEKLEKILKKYPLQYPIISTICNLINIIAVSYKPPENTPKKGKFIELCFQILSIKDIFQDKICPLTAIQYLSKEEKVAEYIRKQNLGKILIQYLKDPIEQERCCIKALIIITHCISHNDDSDEYFINLGILKIFRFLIEKKHIEDRKKVLKGIIEISNSLMSSKLNSTKELVVESGIVDTMLNLFSKNSDSKISNKVLEHFRIFVLSANVETLLEFVNKNIGFLDLILKYLKPKGFKNENIVCMLILNKILGAEIMNCKEFVFRDYMLSSEYLDNLELMQNHKDIDVYNLSLKIIEEFFDSEHN